MDNGCSIGILGGSFDPVHRAHMAIAEAAARRLRLDKILLVPAFQAALKSESVCASDAQAANARNRRGEDGGEV